MNEELPRNEETIFTVQNAKVKKERGCTRNRQRCYVSATGLILWMLAATVALHLWLLRLFGAIEFPF